MIEEDLYTYLTSDPTISGYVSTRIYPVKMPQNVTYPAITYQLIGSTRTLTQDGAVSLVEGRYQIDSWGTSYSTVKNIAIGVKVALHGFKGTWGKHAYKVFGRKLILNRIFTKMVQS